jgi:hypothetical protein
MELIGSRSRRIEASIDGELNRRILWLDAVENREVSSAILAANINVLRREAPFAYLFATGYTLSAWAAEDIGDETAYSRSLDALELNAGFYLAHNSASAVAVPMVVVSVLLGDVRPFVHLLGSDEFALYCTPRLLSLRQLKFALSGAVSSADASKRLLINGGCIVTVIDEVQFAVRSIGDVFEKYFR